MLEDADSAVAVFRPSVAPLVAKPLSASCSLEEGRRILESAPSKHPHADQREVVTSPSRHRGVQLFARLK